MSIQFDSTSQASTGDFAGTTTTWNHSIANNPNRILFVSMLIQANNFSSITCDGNAMTYLNSYVNSLGYYIAVYYYIAPAVGTVSISANHGNPQNKIFFAASYYGVDQTTPIDSSATGTAASNAITQATTVVKSACWLLGYAEIKTGTAIATSSNRTDRLHPASIWGMCSSDSNATVSVGSQSIIFTNSNGAATPATAIVWSLAPYVLPRNSSMLMFF